MQLYHAYAAGKHKLDRIDFFLVERRPKAELRAVLAHFGLDKIRQLIRDKTLSLQEAEDLCIIASKLLTLPEVEALQDYVETIMGIERSKFFYREITPPLTKAALADDTLRLALQKYHQDGLFLALWCNSYYQVPVKIGGFVVQEAQHILQDRAEETDREFADFVQNAATVDDLLGGE
jgi:hypothetical protein